MKHNITELLGLEDVILTDAKEYKDERHFWIELPAKRTGALIAAN